MPAIMLPISSVGAPFLAGRGPAIGLIGRRLTAAAGEDFRAADQDARIDAEGITDKAEHDDGADAEPAAAHRKAEGRRRPFLRRCRRDGLRCRSLRRKSS
jgi:hypothetical protein